MQCARGLGRGTASWQNFVVKTACFYLVVKFVKMRNREREIEYRTRKVSNTVGKAKKQSEEGREMWTNDVLNNIGLMEVG